MNFIHKFPFKVLLIENGAYGQRMIKICRTLNIPHDVLSFNEVERVQIDVVADKLKSNEYTHVAIVHCETSSGILNPIEEIGELVYNHGANKGLLFFFYSIKRIVFIRFNSVYC